MFELENNNLCRHLSAEEQDDGGDSEVFSNRGQWVTERGVTQLQPQRVERVHNPVVLRTGQVNPSSVAREVSLSLTYRTLFVNSSLPALIDAPVSKGTRCTKNNLTHATEFRSKQVFGSSRDLRPWGGWPQTNSLNSTDVAYMCGYMCRNGVATPVSIVIGCGLSLS